MRSDEDITRSDECRRGLGIPGRKLVVSGVELSVADSGGEGVPLVCLHAAGHGSRDFEPLRERGAGGSRVVTVDWPSHGCSGADHVPADVRRYAELTLGVLDGLGLDESVLLGCSVGGAAALRVAALHPERVAGLVLCNAGGLAEPTAVVRGFSRTMAAIFRRGVRGPWWFSWFYAALYRRLLSDAASAQRARIVAAGVEHAPVLAELWQSFSRPVNDVRGHIDELRCPVWLAWAAHDPFNGHRPIAPALARFGPEVELFEGGHAPFLEDADRFNDGLARFVSSLERPREARRARAQ